MRRTIDVVLRLMAKALRETHAGRLDPHRCAYEIREGTDRLKRKIEETSEFSRALDQFKKRAERYIGPAFDTVERQRAFGDTMSAYGQLRHVLENAVPLVTRNEAEEFAKRTRKNLMCIIEAANAGRDVHVVTQLTASLLGIVVFPWETYFRYVAGQLELEALGQDEEWPRWNITLGADQCVTLKDLARRLRNAVAHGRIDFSSDSRNPKEVFIEFEDADPGENQLPHWRADIGALDLLSFCVKFTQLIEGVVG
jgi:hypothetical protein